jgi:hypothetical protein
VGCANNPPVRDAY